MWDTYFGKDLNSAYSIIGSSVVEYEDLLSSLKKTYPDYSLQTFHFETMKIEDAQALRQKNSERGNTLLILVIHFATHETQNALLKFIEEPPKGTHIILCVPHRNTLLDTLYSRCIVIDVRNNAHSHVHSHVENNLLPDAKAFLALSYQERMELIKKLTKKAKEESNGEDDQEDTNNSGEEEDEIIDDEKILGRSHVQNFITELEGYLYTNNKNIVLKKVKGGGGQENKSYVAQRETLESMKKYLANPSASLSMILEMIALDMPVGNLYNNS